MFCFVLFFHLRPSYLSDFTVMAAKYFGKVSQDMYHVDVQATKELSQLKMFLTLYIRTSGEHFFFSVKDRSNKY